MTNPNQIHTSSVEILDKPFLPSYTEGLERIGKSDYLQKGESISIATNDSDRIIRFVLAPSNREIDTESNSVGLIPFYDERGNKFFRIAINDEISETDVLNSAQKLASIGRSDFEENSRTDFVSRAHLNILFENNRLEVLNMGTNGTRVEYYRDPVDAQIEDSENSFEREKSTEMNDLESFEAFVKTHAEQLDKMNARSEVENYIYHNFCENKQPDETMVDGDEFRAKSKKYFEETCKKFTGKHVAVEKNEYWQAITAGSMDFNDLGRIYLNPKNSNYIETFNDIAGILVDKDASFQMKMIKNMDESNYNRSDKLVVYFDKDSAQTVKDELLDYVEANNEKMNTNVPRFTERLRAADGSTLNGIAFAENPTNPKKSFGGQFSEVLTQMYYSAKNGSEFSIADEAVFDSYDKMCRRFGIVPETPYKNAYSSFDMF